MSEIKPNLLHYTLKELETLFAGWDLPRYRAQQVYRWIWIKGVADFEQMSDLGKELRTQLATRANIRLPLILKTEASADGTVKYLLQMDDLKTVETVWLPREDQGRATVCVSSQVGCNMGCTFCLTGQQKVERDLTAGEIAAQLLVMPKRSEITNVVLMGMGEPFDNYTNVMGALGIMTDPNALALGAWRITVSTSGLLTGLRKFLSESTCRLAVSLNGPNDLIRTSLMPVNKAFPISKLMEELRVSMKERPRRVNRVTFEYILIKDVNDRPEHAEELARLLRGLACKVNILLYNENPHVPYKRPTEEDIERFRAVLEKRRVLNFVRQSRGRDISGACGQLASEHKHRELNTVSYH